MWHSGGWKHAPIAPNISLKDALARMKACATFYSGCSSAELRNILVRQCQQASHDTYTNGCIQRLVPICPLLAVDRGCKDTSTNMMKNSDTAKLRSFDIAPISKPSLSACQVRLTSSRRYIKLAVGLSITGFDRSIR